MNKVLLMGRLTRDPDVRYAQDGLAIAAFSMAIDRIGEGTDFPSIKAFGKQAEFAEKYLKKGIKIVVEGRLQTGSYTNKDNVKVYTTDVIAERLEFCESKASASAQAQENTVQDDFVSVPDGLDEELPFV